MPIVIITTVGGVDTNSYVTVEEADAYFATRPNNDWASLDAELKKALLIHAARLNDRLVSYHGVISNRSPRQTLKFPRIGCYDREGILLDREEIPNGIKYGQFEQALYLSLNDADATNNAEYLKANVGKGAVSVEFNINYTIQKLSQAVIDLLGEFGIVDGGLKLGSINTNLSIRV